MEGLAVYRSSIYLGPGVNLVHLVSMCTFMGALLMVDLRLLGAGLTTQPVRSVARGAQPWLIGGFIGLVVTGIPAMMATATMQYASKVFWFKMYVLAAALLLTFTVAGNSPARRIRSATSRSRKPWRCCRSCCG